MSAKRREMSVDERCKCVNSTCNINIKDINLL